MKKIADISSFYSIGELWLNKTGSSAITPGHIKKNTLISLPSLFLFNPLLFFTALAIVLTLAACGGGGGGKDDTTYTVGGSVSGLTDTLVLQNNASDDLTITQIGAFLFTTPIDHESAFNVTVLTQPVGQTCSITNGQGIVSGANITHVEVDCADNSDTEPPSISISSPTDGATLSGSVLVSAVASDNVQLDRVEFNIGANAPLATDTSSPYEFSLDSNILTDSSHAISATAFDTVGNSNTDSINVTVDNTVVVLPPDPADVATEIDTAVATSMMTATEFIFTGTNPIQTGVATGTIEPVRVAVLRGRVMERNEDPIPGVTISILNHPEFGQTLSRTDGMFDMAVNGGEYLTINYQKSGYLPVQRQVKASWEDYASLPDVVMIPLDGQVTTIDLSVASMQVARGSEVVDVDGTRQSTLLIPAGTSAEISFSDGSTRALNTLNIRVTEYTVGEKGPIAMPAELPPSSAYTYAQELSADEAINAGATDITFNQPLYNYVEDFIGFPVGSAVPVGYYDRLEGEWRAEENGRVIKVLSIDSGIAELDTDGDDSADDGTTLAALNISLSEQQQLAALYKAGTVLWRVPVKHFSPGDYNWPYGPPPYAEPPRIKKTKKDKPEEDPCDKASTSTIQCQNQTLGKNIPITGTEFSLGYRNSRVAGYRAAHNIDIPVIGNTLPMGLQSVQLQIKVAGKKTYQVFTPQTNLSYTFKWDGLDAYGRKLQGAQKVNIRVGYVYEGKYYPVRADRDRAFGRLFEAGTISGRTDYNHVILWQEWTETIRPWEVRAQGIGGWSINVHHNFDVLAGVVYFGDGGRINAYDMSSAIRTFAGTGVEGFNGENMAADQAQLNFPSGLALGPDGSIYVADSANHLVRKIKPDGIIERLAGWSAGISGFSGDGQRAIQARMKFPSDVAISTEGTVYIADSNNNRIRRVGPEKLFDTWPLINTVAGGGASQLDNVDALGAMLYRPFSIAVAPDKNYYFPSGSTVQQVATDGFISRIAGLGTYHHGYGPVNVLATDSALDKPWDVITDAHGNVYFSDMGNHVVQRISLDGKITNIAGVANVPGYLGDDGQATGARLNAPHGLAFGADGSLYIADTGNHVIRKVSTEGIITTFAGSGSQGYSVEPGPAIDAQFDYPESLLALRDGSVLVSDSSNHRIRQIYRSLPYLTADETLMLSKDGSEGYLFDKKGRHLRTISTLSGTDYYRFNYDTNGQLSSIDDRDGLTTTIDRDSVGDVSAIVGHYGHRTDVAMDSNGYLTTITNPEGQQVNMTYTTEGLLTGYTDAEKNTSNYEYDDAGYLTKVINAVGGIQKLTRADIENGHEVTYETGLGRQTIYRTIRPESGGKQRITMYPSGFQTTSQVAANGASLMTFSDGTQMLTSYSAHPRWGMQAPLLTRSEVNTRSGHQLITQRIMEITEDENDKTLLNMTDTIDFNGRIFSSSYQASTKSFMDTTAQGRESKLTLDAMTRISEIEVDPLILPIKLTYDADGRLEALQQGAKQVTVSFNVAGIVASHTDANGRIAQYEYDDNNQLISTELDSGRQYQYQYDDNNNLTDIIMPNGAIHKLEYDAINRGIGYLPPENNNKPYTIEYNLDAEIDAMTLPNGREIDYDYDTAGMLTGINYPAAATSLTYDIANAGEQVASISKIPLDTSKQQSITYGYDSFLMTQMDWSGFSNASIEYEYDDNFFLTGITFDLEPKVELSWDDDGLLTQYGTFNFTNAGPAGGLSKISDGTLVLTMTYDEFGNTNSRIVKVNNNPIFSQQFNRDNTSRILHKTESVGTSAAKEIDNEYGPDGSLIKVQIGHITSESYSYDLNGNRDNSSGVISVYDSQDRLTSHNAISYTYDDDGFLVNRGSDLYQYSAFGELKQATVSGQNIIFIYDGVGRRVGYSHGTTNQQYIYANPEFPFQLTSSRDGSGILTHYLYDDNDILFALRRDSTTYYVATDQVGTPRVVSDDSGTIIKLIEYDSFGILISDSNVSFDLVIGFAGGITDPVSELVHFGLRDYDPLTGRWTARDPFNFSASSGNLYLYASNDPVNYRDPSGLISLGSKGGSSSDWNITPEQANKWGKRAVKVPGAIDDSVDFNDFLNDPNESFARKQAAWLRCFFKYMPWGRLPALGKVYEKISGELLDKGLEYTERHIDRVHNLIEQFQNEILSDPCAKKSPKDKQKRNKLPCSKKPKA